MSHYNLRKTESSLNIRGVDKKLPFWDSSDPTRNPQPLPINPDSPSLNPISPFRGNSGSPTRNYGSRTLGVLEDDKIGELTELTKKISETQSAVEKALNETLSEFGTLASRSRDNASALSQLKEKANTTEDHVFSMRSSLEESLLEMKNAMDTQKETRRSMDTVTDGLMKSVGDVVGMMHTHDRHLKDIADTSGGVNQALKAVLDQVALLTQESQSGSLDVIRGVIEHHYTQLQSNFSAIQDLVSEFNSIDQQSFKQISKLIEGRASSTDSAVKGHLESLENHLGRLSTKHTSEITKQYHEATTLQNIKLESILQTLKATSTTADIKQFETSVRQNTTGITRQLEIISDSVKRLGNDQKAQMEVSQKLLAEAAKNQGKASNDQATDIVAELAKNYEAHVAKFMTKFADQEVQYSQLRSILESINDSSEKTDLLTSQQGEKTRKEVEQLLNTHHEKLMTKLLSQGQDVANLKGILESVDSRSGNVDGLMNQQSEEIRAAISQLLKSHQEQLMTKVLGQEQKLSELRETLESINGYARTNDALVDQQSKDTQARIEKLLRSHQEKTQAENAAKHKEILSFFKDSLSQSNKHHQTLSSLIAEQSNKGQPDPSAAFADILSAQLGKSDESIKESLRKLEGDMKNQTTVVQDCLHNEMKLARADIASTDASKDLRDIKTNLSSSSEISAKYLHEIQADVRSLIDLRYDEASSFQETVMKLEAKLDGNQQLLEAKSRIQELEKLLSQKDQKSSADKAVADYQETVIAQNEKKIENLETEIQRLTGNKEAISIELGNLRFEMKSRLEELDRLEERIVAFESRVGDTILDRSKNILGSTALSIINNRALNAPSTPISTSPSKRNLSYAPTDLDDENTDPDADTSLSIAKPRGGGLSPHKNRSISLYTPN